MTPEEKYDAAERRHLFWRNRCMEHAKTINHQLGQIHDMREAIKAALEINQPEDLRKTLIKAIYGE